MRRPSHRARPHREDPTATTNVCYPAMNRLAAEIALDGGTSQTAALPAQSLEPFYCNPCGPHRPTSGRSSDRPNWRCTRRCSAAPWSRRRRRSSAVRRAPFARQRAEDVGVRLRQRDVRALQVPGACRRRGGQGRPSAAQGARGPWRSRCGASQQGRGLPLPRSSPPRRVLARPRVRRSERSRLRGRQRPGARPPARKAAKGRAKKPGRSTR